MVEGRISSSAIVGEGSDVGGGASILGVLSGTSGNAISVGKACLLGANSVTGIPLGDNCIVDAGIAVLEGTKFYSKMPKNLLNLILILILIKIYKGLELKGLNGLHFRQDSISGAMIVALNKKQSNLTKPCIDIIHLHKALSFMPFFNFEITSEKLRFASASKTLK